MTISTMSTKNLIHYAEHIHKSIDPVDQTLINELVKRLQGKNVVSINKLDLDQDLPESLKPQSGT